MTDDPRRYRFKIGDATSYVKISYRVKIADGPVLKGSSEPAIMDFVTGYLQVIPGLEKRLLGHSTGDRLSFTVPPEEAFGARRDDLVIEKPRADFYFPEGVKPYPGMELPLVAAKPNAPDTVMILELKDDTIVVDLNHPLAGASLDYDLVVVEARPAGPNDICSEWGSQNTEGLGCSSAPAVVLGQDPDSRGD
jgi:FKBP-type peptidyl-prolyl cis-trans isomerase 2